MVFEVPKTDVNVHDTNLNMLSGEAIDRQIHNLFKEYKRQKKAYREAINLSH